MKIGMMTAWNQDAGAAISAELIGRQWVKDGHEVRIFSYILSDFHGKAIVGKDEDYVFRCFSTGEKKYLDPRPILECNPDIFITNDLGMFPMDELAKIFPLIKRKAKTINIIHESKLPSNPSFYQFEWDRLICFDQRYKDFLRRVYPDELIEIIPYPCDHWRTGDKEVARERLNLPQSEYIIFTFGQCIDEKVKILPTLQELANRYPILLLVVSTQDPGPLKGNSLKIEIRKEAPDLERLYDYLYAADLLINNQRAIGDDRAMVSTTTYQCLGSGCPIFACASEKFKTTPDDIIIKYRSYEELRQNFVKFFEDSDIRERLKKRQKEYVRRYSPEKIAKMYIELFNEVKK